VTVALVPGTLAWFQQASLIAPLANAVAIPIVTFGVVPLALAGIVVPLDFPWHIAQALLHLTLGWLSWLSASPGAVFASHAPPAWTIAVAVAGALWIVAPRGVPGRILGSLLMLPMVLTAPPAPPPGAARVVVLDVGQGLAALITTTEHALLYDAGPRYRNGDAGSRVVVPYLRAAGVVRLDRLIVSHADTDHSGGVASVLRALPVAAVTSSMDDPAPSGASAPRSGASMPEWTRCVAGERWEWDGVGFEILHPAASAYDDSKRKSNDLSCVLAVTSAAGRVLLTGDIEARSEKELLARAEGLDADVLVVPHHGSLTSSTASFIAAVAPRIAAVTAGYLNHFGHPRPVVLARYRSAGIPVVRTDVDGALVFDLAPEIGIATTLERERRRRYWYDRRRHAGDSFVKARGSFNRRSGRSAPRSRRHAAFATASRVRNRRTDSRSRGRRRERSASARREWSSDPAAAARTRSRRSRSSRRR
jgi:competence protein ComEC